MQALFQKDKAVLNQTVSQMQEEIEVAKIRENNLKKSYQLLLQVLQSPDGHSNQDYLNKAIIESLNFGDSKCQYKKNEALKSDDEEPNSASVNIIF